MITNVIWLDMSAYPERDPDEAFSTADLDVLRNALAIPEHDAVVDGIWDQVLIEATNGAGSDDEVDPGMDDDVFVDEPEDELSTLRGEWAGAGDGVELPYDLNEAESAYDQDEAGWAADDRSQWDDEVHGV